MRKTRQKKTKNNKSNKNKYNKIRAENIKKIYMKSLNNVFKRKCWRTKTKNNQINIKKLLA